MNNHTTHQSRGTGRDITGLCQPQNISTATATQPNNNTTPQQSKSDQEEVLNVLSCPSERGNTICEPPSVTKLSLPSQEVSADPLPPMDSYGNTNASDSRAAASSSTINSGNSDKYQNTDLALIFEQWAKLSRRNIEVSNYSTEQIDNGYCYLRLFPSYTHTRVRNLLGEWPQCFKIFKCATDNNLLSTIPPVRLESTDLYSIHVEFDANNMETLEELIMNLPSNTVIGGYFTIKRVKICAPMFRGPPSWVIPSLSVTHIVIRYGTALPIGGNAMTRVVVNTVGYISKALSTSEMIPKLVTAGLSISIANAVVAALSLRARIYTLDDNGNVGDEVKAVNSQDNDFWDKSVPLSLKWYNKLTHSPIVAVSGISQELSNAIPNIIPDNATTINSDSAVTCLNYNDMFKPYGLIYFHQHYIRPISPERAEVRLSAVNDAALEVRYTNAASPSIVSFTLPNSPTRQFDACLNIFRVRFITSLTTFSTALIYCDNVEQYPQDGFYHLHESVPILPLSIDINASTNSAFKTSEQIRAVYYGSFCEAQGIHDHMFFPLTQYNYDIKTVFTVAEELQCTNVWFIEFNNHDLLTNTYGAIPALHMKWCSVTNDTTEYIMFSSMVNNDKSFTISRDLIRQYTLTTGVVGVSGNYSKTICYTYGDLNLCCYSKQTMTPIPTNLVIKNHYSSDFALFTSIATVSSALSSAEGHLVVIPRTIIDKFLSISSTSRDVTLHSLMSTAQTLRQTYDQNARVAEAMQYIQCSNILQDIYRGANTHTALRKLLPGENNNAGLLELHDYNVFNFMRLIISRSYRRQMYCANTIALMLPNITTERHQTSVVQQLDTIIEENLAPFDLPTAVHTLYDPPSIRKVIVDHCTNIMSYAKPGIVAIVAAAKSCIDSLLRQPEVDRNPDTVSADDQNLADEVPNAITALDIDAMSREPLLQPPQSDGDIESNSNSVNQPTTTSSPGTTNNVPESESNSSGENTPQNIAPNPINTMSLPGVSGSVNDPRKLGHATMNLSLEPKMKCSSYESSSTTQGKLYMTNNGHLSEAIFKNPQYAEWFMKQKFPRLRDEQLNSALFAHSKTIIVRDGVCTALPKTHQDLPSYCIVHWSGNEFQRFIPNDNEKYYKHLSTLIEIQTSCLTTLYLLSAANIRTTRAKGCYYDAINDLNNTSVATPQVIRQDVMNGTVSIVHKGLYYGDANPRYLIYVEGTHAFRLDANTAGTFRASMAPGNVATWTIPLNGPLNDPIGERLGVLFDYEKDILESKDSNGRIESVKEVLLYNITLERTLLKRFSLMDTDRSSSYLRATTEMLVYDTKSNRFLNGKPTISYQFCYSNNEFQELKYDKINKRYSCTNKGPFIFMSDDINFLRERMIIDRIMPIWRSVSTYDFDEINITLVEGVPGCGKTTTICNNHSAKVDLVCTATRAAKEDYVNKYNDSEYYRTYDSILLNGAPICNTIYADEGLMVHAGDLLLAAYVAKAENIIIYGDRQQIPFINRAIGFSMHNEVISLNNITYQNKTYRNPKCMLKILRQFYPNIEFGENTKDGTVRVHKIRALEEIPKSLNVVLVLTQDEKTTALKYFTDALVLTVHEAQGQSHENVALVRLAPQANSIYDSLPHIIVGITRHKNNLTYYSVDTNDTISKALLCKVTTAEEITEELERSFDPIKVHSVIQPLQEFTTVTKRCLYDVNHKDTIDWILSLTSHTSLMDVSYVWETWDSPYTGPNIPAVGTSPQLVQELYNGIFTATDEMTLDSFYNEDPFPLEDEILIDIVKLSKDFNKLDQEYMKPLLRTTQYKRDPGTLTSMVNTVRKRNMDPPVIHFTRPPDIVSEVVDCFIDTYFDKDKLNEGINILNHSSKCHTMHWFNTRDGTRKKALSSMTGRVVKENVYATHNRPDMKPKLDNSHPHTKPAAQSVTAHHPVVTAKYAGTSQYISDLCRYALLPKWIINDGLRPTQLDGLLNFILKDADTCIAQEVDFGKFDKSQEEICLSIVSEIMRRFKVDESTIQQWEDAHKLNLLVYPKIGVALRTKYQRRSGDVMTFIGNTLLLMAVLAYTHDYKSAYGGIFGGDDSIVFLNSDTAVIDQSNHIAAVFNLSAKLENFRFAPKFASKFLIHVNGNYRLVADPIKIITRLGRHDNYNKEHVELSWISFQDSYKYYTDPEIRNAACLAANYRYKSISNSNINDYTYFGEFISELVSDKNLYCSLFSGTAKVENRPLLKSIRDKIGRQQSRQMGLITEIELDLQKYGELAL